MIELIGARNSIPTWSNRQPFALNIHDLQFTVIDHFGSKQKPHAEQRAVQVGAEGGPEKLDSLLSNYSGKLKTLSTSQVSLPALSPQTKLSARSWSLSGHQINC
jgi:hypothetical protein